MSFGRRERAQWPSSESDAHTRDRKSEKRTSLRPIRGARHFIEYRVERFSGGRVVADGSLPLTDGTVIDWYLWEGQRPRLVRTPPLVATSGRYTDELYDVSIHPATFRSFGISEGSVTYRLWLVARPPEAMDDPKRFGVYPSGDRNALYVTGGNPLPMNEWGSQFAENMPDDILSRSVGARGRVWNGHGLGVERSTGGAVRCTVADPAPSHTPGRANDRTANDSRNDR